MKFKSKSLISIILSIMMVMSMILVAIPANAAVIDSVSVGADTYYIWYNLNNNNAITSSGAWSSKPMNTSDNGTTYYYDITSAGDNIFVNFNQSDSSATASSSIWSDSDSAGNAVTNNSTVVTSFGGQNYSSYNFLRLYAAKGATFRITYSPSLKTVVLSDVSSDPTGSTVASSTTPVSTNSWVLTGDNYGSWDASNENAVKLSLVSGKTNLYSASVSSLSGYFGFYLKSGDSYNQYGPSNNGAPLPNSSADAATISSGTTNAFNIQSAVSNVTVYLDDSNSSSIKVWYESSTEPTTTEPVETTVPPTTAPVTTPGAYTITDATTDLNGSLSFSASGGTTAGTANSGDTVTITGNPVKSYFELDTVTVTGADNSSIQVSGTGDTRTFTMPAQNVTATATFKLNKPAYIQSLKEDGLWIDVAPDKYDTTATLIKWNNYTGNNHGTNSYYTFYVPKNVDLTNAKVYNGYNSDVVLNNVTIPANSCNTAPLSIPVSDTNYTTSGGTTSQVKVMQGSTNAMFLYTTNTDGSDKDLPTKIDGSLTTKDTVKATGGLCTTMVLNSNGTSTISSAMALDTVKGRGNSSWEASYKLFGKYAFNMKLGSKTKLFGMDSAKSWCLLANNADESMIRNALTYQLAAEIGIQDSPEFRFVDIYDNGEYLGSYLVTEKVDVGNSKLVKGESFDDINDKAANKNVDEGTKRGTYTYNGTQYNMQYANVLPSGSGTSAIDYDKKGKYLLEFEIKTRLFPSNGNETNTSSEASWFRSPRGQYVVVKSPEFATKEQVTYIAQKFAAMEAMIFTSDATKAQLSSVMDVESFAKMYLIQEFSSNLDSAATSYYMTFDCAQTDPVFVANPVWDYDWAYGQYEKKVKEDVNNNLLDSANPKAWFAKSKQIGDNEADSNNKYSIQSQLATNNSDFKSVVRKVWEETNGFYDKIQTYYAADGQIDTWYKQIKDSVDMNETRWGFIANDPLIKGESGNGGSDSWGSKNTGDNHEAAVNYLKTDWTATRADWLNTELTKAPEYTTYTPDAPTIMLCDANGNAITAENPAVEKGKRFIIKVTSPVENNVVYRFFKNDGTQVGADQSDGILEFATDGLTVGETYTYKVQAVYNGNTSSYSDTVSVRIDDKAGNKQVTIYFKSASASAYVPSLSVDGSAPAVMTRNKQGEANSTYFGSTYSGSLKFYWFYTTMKIDTSVAHTLTFTTKDNRVNAKKSYTFSAAEGNNYYFAVNNLMGGDTEVIDLTGEPEYIRNYHISATHMVHSTTYDNNVGFTWIKGTEYAMGTYLKDNNISTASLTDLTSSSLLTIPSALTPNAMLEASSAPSFFTIKSATLAQRITAEAEEVSTLQYQLLDVNLDGKVDIKDSTMMQKALAGF